MTFLGLCQGQGHTVEGSWSSAFNSSTVSSPLRAIRPHQSHIILNISRQKWKLWESRALTIFHFTIGASCFQKLPGATSCVESAESLAGLASLCWAEVLISPLQQSARCLLGLAAEHGHSSWLSSPLGDSERYQTSFIKLKFCFLPRTS